MHALARVHDGCWMPQELQARRESLRKATAALDQQLERLTEAYLIAVIPGAEYQRRRQELEQKRASLDLQMNELATQVDRQAEVMQLATSVQEFCRRTQAGLAQATFEQKRTLVELLVDRVLVIRDEVEIRYAVPTHPRGESSQFCHLRKDYFNDIVEILALAQTYPARERAVRFQCRHCRRVRAVLIHVHDAGSRVLLRSKHFAEEPFGSFRVALCREQEIDGLAG